MMPADDELKNRSLVYFVRIGRNVKIGVTTNLEKRIKAFKTASAEDISVVAVFDGDRSLERYLHGLFARFRIRNEFFREDWLISNFLLMAERDTLEIAVRWATDWNAEMERQASLTRTERKFLSDQAYQKIVAERIRLRDATFPRKGTVLGIKGELQISYPGAPFPNLEKLGDISK